MLHGLLRVPASLRETRVLFFSVAFPRKNSATVPEPALNMLKGQTQSLSGTGRRNWLDNGGLMDGHGIPVESQNYGCHDSEKVPDPNGMKISRGISP